MPQQKQLKVLLIGDSCTDEYVYGSCERLNPEAPVPILKFNRKETKKGMAWNVRENIESFGIEVYMITNQETITKTRYIDEKYNQQILRVDDEPDLKPMNYDLPEEHFDALVISDYDKGFLSNKKVFELVEWFDGPVFIDSKKTKLPKESCFVKINDLEFSKLDNPADNPVDNPINFKSENTLSNKEIKSISCISDLEPITSASHCKNSLNLPFCGLSALQTF